MLITVEIKSCSDCRYRDHSGAFTPGGAKPVCGHPDACDDWKKRVTPYRRVFDKNGYDYCRLPKKIPDWCPLKHGSSY